MSAKYHSGEKTLFRLIQATLHHPRQHALSERKIMDQLSERLGYEIESSAHHYPKANRFKVVHNWSLAGSQKDHVENNTVARILYLLKTEHLAQHVEYF